MPISDTPQVAAKKAFWKRVDELNAENKRLRAALAEIAELKGEDLYRAEDDNQAAYLAREALNYNDH